MGCIMHLNIALCWAAVQPATSEQVVRGDEESQTVKAGRLCANLCLY